MCFSHCVKEALVWEPLTLGGRGKEIDAGSSEVIIPVIGTFSTGYLSLVFDTNSLFTLPVFWKHSCGNQVQQVRLFWFTCAPA